MDFEESRLTLKFGYTPSQFEQFVFEMEYKVTLYDQCRAYPLWLLL